MKNKTLVILIAAGFILVTLLSWLIGKNQDVPVFTKLIDLRAKLYQKK